MQKFYPGRYVKYSACVMVVFVAIVYYWSPVHSAKKQTGTIVDTDISTSQVWTKDGNPYLLNKDIFVRTGVRLDIQPGVVVGKTSDASDIGLYLDPDASLHINGTEQEPVQVSQIFKIHSRRASMSIKYARFTKTTVVAYMSDLNFASSSVTGASGSGLYLWASKAKVRNSVFENNGAAGIYGLREPELQIPSEIDVTYSSFINNNRAIDNTYNFRSVEAKDNWWGSESGPSRIGINRIVGDVTYDPWLDYNPVSRSRKLSCCSSILFLPGLEGSRLYYGDKKLWEPYSSSDLEIMHLDSFGSSTKSDITVGSVIGSAYGAKDIYGSFINYLSKLVQDGHIYSWKEYAYDWRMPASTTALIHTLSTSTTKSLLDEAIQLASSSFTGKINIVAHSNGGLVARYFIKHLQELGLSNIVDTYISVAVPYLGTPEAIAGLLHGNGHNILNGFFLNESSARNLGRNMPSLYQLLPSKKYFENVSDPTIIFSDDTPSYINDGSYARSISSYFDQESFLADKLGIRKQPDSAEINKPIIANDLLIGLADNIHREINNFVWPNNIDRYGIVGTSHPTASAVRYGSRQKCSFALMKSTCVPEAYYEIVNTDQGDGTVVASSATYGTGTTTSINLTKLSEAGDRRDHSNILGSSVVQDTIRKIVLKDYDSLEPDNVITLGAEQQIQSNKSSVAVSTHSPVELHVYDKYGRHTGLVESLSIENTDSYVKAQYEENIPGSRFRITDDGSGGYHTFIDLPYDVSSEYSISIKGTGFGFASYEVELNTESDSKRVLYETIVTSPLLIASSSISTDRLDPLLIDNDGDGGVDDYVTMNGTGLPGNATTTKQAEVLATDMMIDVIEKFSIKILGDTSSDKKVLMKFDKLRKLIKQNKLRQFEKQSLSLLKLTGHINIKELSKQERLRLVGYIKEFIEITDSISN